MNWLYVVYGLVQVNLKTVDKSCGTPCILFERKRRRKLQSNFRWSGVSLKFCECIYDRKWTKFAAKKSHLVVEIATTIGNLKTTNINRRCPKSQQVQSVECLNGAAVLVLVYR
jgi:hypothetical protein